MSQTKLPPAPQKITDAERAVLETFIQAKWAGKQADEYFEQVKEIIARVGKYKSGDGVLLPADSTSYPMPTLAQWQERIANIEADLESLEAVLFEPPDAETMQKIDYVKAQLEQAHSYTPTVVSVLETQEWLKETLVFLRAAGVIQPDKTPTVKFTIAKPAPPKAPKPKLKAVAS